MTIHTRSLLAGVALLPMAATAFAPDACAQTAQPPQPQIQADPAGAARDFEIAGGALDAALVAYARQANVQLLYTADLVAGLRTQGVVGRHPPEAALRRLLAGTGIRWLPKDSTWSRASCVGRANGLFRRLPVARLPIQSPRSPLSCGSKPGPLFVATSRHSSRGRNSSPISLTAMDPEELAQAGPDSRSISLSAFGCQNRNSNAPAAYELVVAARDPGASSSSSRSGP
jgi:hypothetical protein